jgi:hypothetical protein
MRQIREGEPFGRWELEAGAVVKRIAGERGEARVSHQCRIRSSIGNEWRPALIARASAMRADNEVIINTNRYRLCITKAVSGRMTTATGVVIVQSSDGVEPQQAAKVSLPMINVTSQSLSKCRFDATRKSLGL